MVRGGDGGDDEAGIVWWRLIPSSTYWVAVVVAHREDSEAKGTRQGNRHRSKTVFWKLPRCKFEPLEQVAVSGGERW